MSTDRVVPISSLFAGNLRRRTAALPEDPTEEEVARDWTLSAEDKEQVFRCRGDANRLGFALQLCVLRRNGRFLQYGANVPVRILSHLNQQLDLPPKLSWQSSSREATQLEHERRIREYLGAQPFDAAMQSQLERWVWSRAAEGLSTNEILPEAEDTLRFWNVLLPAPSTLERLVSSSAAQAQEQLFERIERHLPKDLCVAIDQLLDVPETDQRSTLFRLKEYPPEATPRILDQYVDRHMLLSELGVDRIELSGLSRDLVR
ncbi:MAG: DUF4158 domain-containing protein [Acidobacteriota bacterium]|nr:DUF4158 domain-containing protein [Acidobacteriota bacterium]